MEYGFHFHWACSRAVRLSYILALQSQGGREIKVNLISDRCFTQEPPRGLSWQWYFKTLCKK